MPMIGRGQAGIPFILITLFLDVMGIGLIIPVLPHLVTSFLHGDSSRAASYYGLLASSYALAQFLFAPVLGALSDRFGRRPVLLISLFGFGVNYLMLALAPDLRWLFVARVLSGITGASITTANAYIADVSTPENRAQNFGLVGAMFGLGFVFGPAIGGLLGKFGPRIPFWVAMGIVILNWFYGLLVLPESLPPEKRRAFSWREANPLGGVGRLRRYPLVAGLAFAFLFVALAQRGLESIWVLYTHYRFGWSEFENGLTLALMGLTAVLVQGVLIRRIIPKLGEWRSILLGLSIAVLAYVLYGLSAQSWMLFAVIVFASLSAIASPAIQGLVAGEVSPSEQGGIQGALTSLLSLTAILAPLISTQVFTACTGKEARWHLPGISFFLGAIFLLVALLMILRLKKRYKPTTTRH